MSDAAAASLRTLLSRIDGTAPAIQGAAGAMMKHYDRSAGVAVNEWRNSLQTATHHQLLPLLYVANEVLQNSKRNRGNKFLEAMSPVLGQSLQHICRKDPTMTEKVRRTVKIWGDRHVLSVRFVNDLLTGLEPFRPGSMSPSGSPATFSPLPTENVPKNESADDVVRSPRGADKADGDIDEILAGDDSDSGDDLDGGDLDTDVFAAASRSQKLELEMDFGAVLEASAKPASIATVSKAKRRRSSMSAGSHGSKPRKRKSILSTSHMIDMWNQLSELDQKFQGAQAVLSRIDERHEKISHSELENKVGDELQQAYKQNESDQVQMAAERKNLHAIAQERRQREVEAMRYLSWLEESLKHDEEEMQFCDLLEQKILSFKEIHTVLSDARNKRLAEDLKKLNEKRERDRIQKEREDQEKFKREALARETEAKPGMVWNRTTREYQSLNTDESWRE
jgi:hypothetical protein